MKTSKSVSEIASEIGVTPQAVRKKIKSLGLQTSLQTEGKAFIIDVSSENALKQAFKGNANKPSLQTNSNSLQTNGNSLQTDNSQIITLLQENLKVLQTQLEEKDKQISSLSEALVASQQTAATAQALHAGTIQRQLTDSTSNDTSNSKSTINENNNKIDETNKTTVETDISEFDKTASRNLGLDSPKHLKSYYTEKNKGIDEHKKRSLFERIFKK